MDKIYTVHVFDTLNSNGFGYILTAHTRLTLPDGREAMESEWGSISILNGSVRHATSMAGARQLVIDELHRRCGIIKDEISELRTQILSEELEVQNG
jgi:hypothetical protein